MNIPTPTTDRMRSAPTYDNTLPAVAGGRSVRAGKEYLVFQAPDIREGDIAAVVDCLRRRWIGTGPKVNEFERAFATYKGVEHAAAVNSCTAAMFLTLLAMGVGPGDEVVTTAMTFCSTVNTILHVGARPVLADCERESLNIDPVAVEACITPRTKVLLVVHMTGRPANMDALLEIARRYKLLVIEDCAHAIETEYRSRSAGTIGDAGCFSFYSTKNITTAEGGMVLARDPALLQRVRMLALHGMTRDAWKRFGDAGYRHYDLAAPGYKMNLTDLAAAIGVEQLKRVEESWQRRVQIWNAFVGGLAGLPLILPAPPAPDTRHAHHLFTALVLPESLRVGRDAVLAAFHSEGIGVGVHYRAVHTLSYYRDAFQYPAGRLPNAEFIGDRTISLPIASWMTDEDVDDVVRACRRILSYYAA